MKSNIAIVLLVFAALLLGVVLLHNKREAEKRTAADQEVITDLSNSVRTIEGKLSEQKSVNDRLVSDLTSKVQDLQTASNQNVRLAAEYAKATADAKAAAEAAAAEIAKRDQRIGQLETERDDLDKKMVGLNGELESLTSKINDTERKLAASEGDRDFLLKELKRLQSEKADLERKFNDLVVLRTQVNKLRDELSAARRLDWFRRGLYGDQPKGAELLMRNSQVKRAEPPATVPTEVDIRSGGGAAIRAVPGATNSPAVNP
jgi:chromosome segregation ATPase